MGKQLICNIEVQLQDPHWIQTYTIYSTKGRTFQLEQRKSCNEKSSTISIILREKGQIFCNITAINIISNINYIIISNIRSMPLFVYVIILFYTTNVHWYHYYKAVLINTYKQYSANRSFSVLFIQTKNEARKSFMSDTTKLRKGYKNVHWRENQGRISS